jgi:DNA-binding transcriptional LysR family regulator
MNIRQLEYLVETVRSGSYAKASEKLFVTPQAVAKSLAELEREYDVELLIKDGRGIKVTSVAREFARQADDLLQTVADFDRHMRSKPSEYCESGHVVLAVEAYEHRAEALDRHALAAFHDQYPAIEVEVMPLLGDSCRSSIGLGMADAAIVLGMQTVEGCTCRKLYSFCPYAALSESHLSVLI